MKWTPWWSKLYQPVPLRAFAVPFQVFLVAVAVEVVFAGNVEHLAGLDLLEEFGHRVELLRLGEVGEVARVQDERGRLGQGVDPGDRLPERAGDVLVGIAGESEVAVADLHERERRLRGRRVWPNTREVAIPPVMPQTNPVPTHAMHLSMPRRSIPSSLGDSCGCVLFRPAFFCPRGWSWSGLRLLVQRASQFHTGRPAEIFLRQKETRLRE